jgi:hypothetical protein
MPSENPPPRAGVDQDGAIAGAARGERGGDDGEPRRRHERRGHPRDEAGEDEEPDVGGEPAEPGEDHEHHEPGEEHPPPAHEVRRPATQQHEAAVAEHVGGHHPLQRTCGHAEISADRRQGHTHHRDVDALEEDRAAQHEQKPLSAATHALVERG